MVFVDREGHILGHHSGEGCNPTRSTDEKLRATVEDILAVAKAENAGLPERVSVVLAGIAGGSHPKNGARLRAAFRAALPGAGSVRIVSDTVSALWSGTFGRPGIVLVAGTGATAYGEDSLGRWHRSGGWGYLVGDDGSGYAMGRQAIRAVCRHFDGPGKPTSLWRKVSQAYGLSESIDLVPFVYDPARAPFDDLVGIVLEAYLEGDETAVEVVESTVKDQIDLILAVRDALDFGDAPFALVLRGGLVQKDRIVRDLLVLRLRERLQETAFDLDTVEARPVVGSAALALKEIGRLTPQTLDTLLAESEAAGLLRSPR